MGPFVLDASVALKWFLPEEQSEHALRLRAASADLHVPAFFLLEFGHVVCKKQRRRELSMDDAVYIVRIIRSVALRRHEDAALLPRALELALRLNSGLYDCMYLALAIELDCRLVTADRRLTRLVRGTTLADSVLWIEDVPSSS